MIVSEFLEDGELTELIWLATGHRTHVLALWQFDADPLFGDRASATQINFMAETSELNNLNQNDLAIRPNGDRYKIRSLNPTCGDGLLTVVNVTRDKS